MDISAGGRTSLSLLLLAAAVCACREETHEDGPTLPTPEAFHEHVLAVVKSYPTDGTHGYHWPQPDPGTWLGNARDLTYRGRLFSKGDPKGRCHCSGLTFEVFLQAWERWCRSVGRPHAPIPGHEDPGDLRRFQRQWFGAGGDRATIHTAVVGNELGRRVLDWEEARPGDFVQLWRGRSGHSCVFRAWVREEKRIVGLRYWSTQKSTHGIGEREERFGEAGKPGVKRDELYVVRVGRRPK